MSYKFEKLEIWTLSVEFLDDLYELTDTLPESEKFNLCSQLKRAGTSVSLNIAEGAVGQTNSEQIRFLNYAHRSLMEVVACLIILKRRSFISEETHHKYYSKTVLIHGKIYGLINYLRRNE